MPKQLTKAQQMGEEKAFPVPGDAEHYGLTKREYFAGLVMPSIVAFVLSKKYSTEEEETMARAMMPVVALHIADGLLEALNA